MIDFNNPNTVIDCGKNFYNFYVNKDSFYVCKLDSQKKPHAMIRVDKNISKIDYGEDCIYFYAGLADRSFRLYTPPNSPDVYFHIIQLFMNISISESDSCISSH